MSMRIVALCIALLPLVACAPDLMVTSATAAAPTAGQMMEVILDFELLTRTQMIAEADAIFVGQVTDISPTSWNQDSGEYWEQEIEGTTLTAMPIHQLELAVTQPIVNEIGLSETAVLTIRSNRRQSLRMDPFRWKLFLMRLPGNGRHRSASGLPGEPPLNPVPHLPFAPRYLMKRVCGLCPNQRRLLLLNWQGFKLANRSFFSWLGKEKGMAFKWKRDRPPTLMPMGITAATALNWGVLLPSLNGRAK
jgi:hypothetical protein